MVVGYASQMVRPLTHRDSDTGHGNHESGCTYRKPSLRLPSIRSFWLAAIFSLALAFYWIAPTQDVVPIERQTLSSVNKKRSVNKNNYLTGPNGPRWSRAQVSFTHACGMQFTLPNWRRSGTEFRTERAWLERHQWHSRNSLIPSIALSSQTNALSTHTQEPTHYPAVLKHSVTTQCFMMLSQYGWKWLCQL